MARKNKRKRFSKHKHISKVYVSRQLTTVLQTGKMLSNIAFQMKNPNFEMTETFRIKLDFWQKRWDRNKNKLSKWMKIS
jgi:hypothetical protein